MCLRKLLPSAFSHCSQIWQYALFSPECEARCESRTCLYMNDLVQPGKVHLNGPSDESEVGAMLERCFFEMWPVKAASEPKVAVQVFHAQVVVPLGQ